MGSSEVRAAWAVPSDAEVRGELMSAVEMKLRGGAMKCGVYRSHTLCTPVSTCTHFRNEGLSNADSDCGRLQSPIGLDPVRCCNAGRRSICALCLCRMGRAWRYVLATPERSRYWCTERVWVADNLAGFYVELWDGTADKRADERGSGGSRRWVTD